jgi:hypothetical protein
MSSVKVACMSLESAHPIKLCKNCVHFRNPPAHMPLEYGKCSKYGVVNLVSGTIELDFASIAREYKCKGSAFKAKAKTTPATMTKSSSLTVLGF